MDSKGEDIEGLEANDDDEDLDATAMRQILKDTVKRQHDESFQGLAWAIEEIEAKNRRAEEGLDKEVDSADFMKVHTLNLRLHASHVQFCCLFDVIISNYVSSGILIADRESAYEHFCC
jgi:hypothetical protein